MTKQRILAGGMSLAATLSMVACGPATNTPTTPASPNASPSAAVSATPAATPTPDASPSAAVSATPTPEATPTAAVSASPVPASTPTPAATNTPLPAATSDISVIERTTFNGKVFDDTNSPLDGVTVKVKSLNSSVPFEAETVTAGGTFAFNNAPSGVQVEIVASKAGFTTRKRVEVLKSNKQGDPNANRYDFGTDNNTTTFSATYNALSDKPEVTMVTPARNGSGVDPKTSFVVKFSEPMDRKTVEDTFTVRTFNNRKLTVDAGSAADTFTAEAGTVKAPNLAGSKIWDKDAFNISWNSDDTEATFSFKEEKLLPTDKDSNLVPDYMVTFTSFAGTDKLLKDKSGISRDKEYFKLTDGDFEGYYKFAIKTDEVKPTISGITAETNENGGQNGDAIRVRYSERMIIYTRDKSIAGGMDDKAGADTKAAAGYPGATANATIAKTASNYNMTIIQTGGQTSYAGTWGALGGTAVYDTSDLTHKTVLLLPPAQATLSSTVAARPSNLGTTSPTYVLADGTTSAQSAATFFRNTSSATATGAAVAGGVTGNNTATIDLFYADGTSDLGVVTNATGGDTNAAGVQTALNSNGMSGWTVTNAAGVGNIAATNSITYTLATNAQRTGKNIAVAVIRQTNLFAAGALNAPATGLVVVSGAPSLASFTTVTAPNANADIVSVDFRYTDGSSETVNNPAGIAIGASDVQVQIELNSLMTGNTGWTVTRALGAAALAAGNFLHVGLSGNATRNGKTVAAARLNPTGAFATTKLGNAAHPNGIWVIGSDALQTQHMLNSKLLSTGGLFTVTETNSGAAGSMARIWDANDTLTLALAAGAKVPAGTGVSRVTIPQTGHFATGELNAPAAGFVVYPNTAVNGRLDIYKPGDTVRIKVNSTVLDPAGNTLDSSRDNASANAS